MTDEEMEFVRRASADISHVRAFSGPDATEDTLRQVSPQARELLDQRFHRAWRLIMEKKSATIECQSISKNTGDVVFAAITDSDDSVPIMIPSHEAPIIRPVAVEYLTEHGIVSEPLSPSPGAVAYHPTAGHVPDDVFVSRNINIFEFMDQCVILSGDLRVSRRDLVQYVANTRGGNHDHLGGKPRPRTAAIFKALDDIASSHTTLARDTTFAVFMATCQSFAKSSDVIEFQNSVSALPPPREYRR